VGGGVGVQGSERRSHEYCDVSSCRFFEYFKIVRALMQRDGEIQEIYIFSADFYGEFYNGKKEIYE
jgi:hypothetical protein